MTALIEREAGKRHLVLYPGRGFWWTVISTTDISKIILMVSWQSKFLKKCESIKEKLKNWWPPTHCQSFVIKYAFWGTREKSRISLSVLNTWEIFMKTALWAREDYKVNRENRGEKIHVFKSLWCVIEWMTSLNPRFLF